MKVYVYEFHLWSETDCTVYTVHLVWEGGGGEVREKVEGQKYRSRFTGWVENTNHEWRYLQSIKSVKHNAAKSVNRSILKKADI